MLLSALVPCKAWASSRWLLLAGMQLTLLISSSLRKEVHCSCREYIFCFRLIDIHVLQYFSIPLLRVSGLAGAGGRRDFSSARARQNLLCKELVPPCKPDLCWELLECLITLKEIQGKEGKGSKSTGENIT